MKRHKLIIGFALVAILVIGLLLHFSGLGGSGPTSTDTQSKSLAGDRQKIAFLGKYLKMNSDIEATEFHIVYHDNSRGVPGPSDCDMQVVMKMPKENLPLWTAGLQQTNDQVDLAWGHALLPREERWSIKSAPMIYMGGQGIVVAVFESEGIIFKRVQN